MICLFREASERTPPDSHPAGLSFRGPSLVFSAGTRRRYGPGNRDKGKRDAVGIRAFPAGGPRRADGWSARGSVSVPSRETSGRAKRKACLLCSSREKNLIFVLTARIRGVLHSESVFALSLVESGKFYGGNNDRTLRSALVLNNGRVWSIVVSILPGFPEPH